MRSKVSGKLTGKWKLPGKFSDGFKHVPAVLGARLNEQTLKFLQTFNDLKRQNS